MLLFLVVDFCCGVVVFFVFGFVFFVDMVDFGRVFCIVVVIVIGLCL